MRRSAGPGPALLSAAPASPGGSGPLDADVRQLVERAGESRRPALVHHLQRPLRRRRGVVAERGGLPGQPVHDLVEPAHEADGAGIGDASSGLEQEQVLEVGPGRRPADPLAGRRPLVLRRHGAAEAAVRREVAFAVEPLLEAAVEGADVLQRRGRQAGEPLASGGAEESFDLAFPGRMVGSGVDQGDAEPGADHAELARAEVGAVVAVEPLRQAAPLDRLAQHLQVAGGILAEAELGVRDQPGGVVEQAEKVGLAPAALLVPDPGPVHDVGLPELAGGAGGKAALVPCRAGRRPPVADQPLAMEQPVDGRGRQLDLVGDAAGVAGAGDDLADAEVGVLLPDRQQRLDRLRLQPARGGAPAGPRLQPVDAEPAVAPDPVAHRLRSDAAAPGAGDLPVALGQPGQRRGGLALRQMQDLCDDAVSEQRHLGSCVGFGVFHVGFSCFRAPGAPSAPLQAFPRRKSSCHVVLAARFATRRRVRAGGIRPDSAPAADARSRSAGACRAAGIRCRGGPASLPARPGSL